MGKDDVLATIAIEVADGQVVDAAAAEDLASKLAATLVELELASHGNGARPANLPLQSQQS